jgi:hypothetical protein
MGSTAGAAVAALRGGVAALSEFDPASLSDAALLELVREVEVVYRRVQAQRSRLFDCAHRRGAALVDGAASTASWLRGRLHLGDASHQLRIAAAAREVDHVGEAYARGEISAEHVAVVAHVLPDLDPEVVAAGAGKLLAEQAAELTPQLLRRVAARIRDHFDAESADRRGAQRAQRRWLRVAKTFDGAVAVDGMLDPDGGELLLATLAALTPPPRPGDERTGERRRADALLDLCRLAGRHAPTAGGEKPHVTVTVDLPTLQRSPAGRGATLGDGTPLGAQAARRLACDAAVIPAVLGSAGEVLDLGRLARVVSAAQRRALVLRDRGCRFPGCDRPPGWTDAHHLVHWAQGGPTDLDNLLLLCRWHHVAVHEGQWRIHLDTHTNTATAVRPDGHPLDLTSRPPAHPP